MIGVKITGDMSVINTVNSLSRNIDRNQQLLNTARAKKFREQTIKLTKSDSLGLMAIEEKTRANRKADLGGPLYDEGELLNAQKIHEEKDKSTEVGYFPDDTERHSDSNLTNEELARIQTAGVNSKTGKRPRPFYTNSAFRWEKSDQDEKLSEKFLEEQKRRSNV